LEVFVEKGTKFTAEVEVIKAKNGKEPTVIRIDGRVYTLVTNYSTKK
jgi:hypothetical protein